MKKEHSVTREKNKAKKIESGGHGLPQVNGVFMFRTGEYGLRGVPFDKIERTEGEFCSDKTSLMSIKIFTVGYNKDEIFDSYEIARFFNEWARYTAESSYDYKPDRLPLVNIYERQKGNLKE